jgi:D-threo-aldose 1-dehydrogenase
MKAAERRLLGATGIAVSRLGIGGGSLASAAGEAGVKAVVAAAWDAGLRHFDTAAFYAGGESERRLGLALAGRERADFTVSTKTGRYLLPDGTDRFDYSAAGTEATIATALARLGLQRLDMVFIHDVQPSLHGEAHAAHVAATLDGAFPALARLKATGVVGAIGIAMRDPAPILRLLAAAPFDVVMLAGGCTLLHQDACAALLPHCVRTNTPVLFAAPFETGLLATGAVPGARYRYRPAPPEMLARVAAMQAVCSRHGVTLAAAAIQFPLRSAAIASVVVGHQSPAEVAANMALLEQPIPEALWRDLRAEGLIEAMPD